MLSIKDGEALSRALASPIGQQMKQLLQLRCAQLGGDISDLAHFAIVEPSDTPVDLEQIIGFSVFQNLVDGTHFGAPYWSPSWEWLADHGFCFEMVFIMDDSGFGHVVIIPNEQGIAPTLIDLCRTFASEDA